MLCDDGGQPAYDIDLLGDVSKDPEKYLEVLWPWVSDRKDWNVFCCQMKRWEEFRLYQRYWRREDKFALHVEGLEDRLASHDATRIYQLDDHFFDEDPVRQGKLETWIEYVLFEYLEQEKFTQHMNECYQHSQQALKMIVDSENLFSEGEILTNRARRFFDAELYKKYKKAEEKDLKKAESKQRALSQSLLAQPSHNRSEKLRKRLTDAESFVSVMKGSVARCIEKISLATEYNERQDCYTRAAKETRPYNARIEWICDQIRWLEYELGVELPRAAQSNKHGVATGLFHNANANGFFSQASFSFSDEDDATEELIYSDEDDATEEVIYSDGDDATEELNHNRGEEKPIQKWATFTPFQEFSIADFVSSNEDDATEELNHDDAEEKKHIQGQSAEKPPQAEIASHQNSEFKVVDVSLSQKDDAETEPISSPVKKSTPRTCRRVPKRSRCEDSSDHKSSGLNVVSGRGRPKTPAVDQNQLIAPRRSARIAKKQKAS